MSSLRQFVVSLKAWQAFLLLVAPMFASQWILMGAMADSIQPGRSPDLVAFEELFSRMMTAVILMLSLILIWLWSISTCSNKRIAPSLRPNMKWFYRCGIYVVSYAVALKFVLPDLTTIDAAPGYAPIFILLHFAATASMVYLLGFTAKNMTLVGREESVSFFDYSGPFFLIWFFPIGVWFVQPRINRISRLGADGT